MIRYVLMDIEGTTTSLAFVHDTLFPYAAQHLKEYVATHHADATVQSCIEETKATVLEENKTPIDDAQAVEQLLQWIAQDRKHPALKRLQGFIWQSGYENGSFKSHVYADVPDTLKKWQAAGIQMGIYSSGSVEAQQFLFGYTEYGDLTPLLSHYFDTRVGHKRETTSYHHILSQIAMEGQEVLFLSDVEAELDAAKEAGLQTMQVLRPGVTPTHKRMQANDFVEVQEQLSQFA